MLQKPVSQASPKIVENTFLATALGKVTIEATRQIGDKDVVYLQMELDASSNLRELFTKFTSVSTEVHPSWGLMEQISLSFGHTNMTYTVFNEFGEKEGEVTSAFDCG